jgi:hypothetical protein
MSTDVILEFVHIQYILVHGIRLAGLS